MKTPFDGRWHVPQVYQREAAECFLACAAMLAKRDAPAWSLPRLRAVAPVSSRGCSVADGVRALRGIGYEAYAASVSLADLDTLDGPAILHWRFDHYVVYAGRRGDRYFINDPALGPRRVDAAEFSDSFTGVLIVADGRAAPPPDAGDGRELRLRDLFAFDRGYRCLIAEIVALTLCVQITVLALPFVMSRIIGDAGAGDAAAPATIVLLGVAAYLAVSLYSVVCASLKEWAIVRVNQHLDARMSGELFGRLFGQSIGFIRRRNPSDLASRFESVSAVGVLFSQGIVAAAFDILTLLASSIALIALAPKIAAVTIAGAFAYAAVRGLAMRWSVPLTENLLLSDSRLKAHTLETIKAHHVLVGAGALASRREAWHSLLRTKLEYARRMALLQGALHMVRGGIPALELSAVLLLGVLSIRSGEIAVGALAAVLAYRQRLFDVASGVADKYAAWREIGVHIDRLGDVWTPANAPRLSADHRPGALLSLREVGYRHPGEALWCFEGIDFDVAEGEMIAIVGPTGSGKSTLLSIAAGHERPTRGRVSACPALAQTGAVAIVFQDDVIVDATIIDNVTMGRSDIDPAEVERALDGASLLEDVNRMPAGLNSVVGPGGAFLSGGQRQRLALARALLGRPTLLILDEATSHLDVATERKVMASLLRHAGAVLFAAHRPDAIARATGCVRVDARAARADAVNGMAHADA